MLIADVSGELWIILWIYVDYDLCVHVHPGFSYEVSIFGLSYEGPGRIWDICEYWVLLNFCRQKKLVCPMDTLVLNTEVSYVCGWYPESMALLLEDMWNIIWDLLLK